MNNSSESICSICKKDIPLGLWICELCIVNFSIFLYKHNRKTKNKIYYRWFEHKDELIKQYLFERKEVVSFT